MRSGLRTLKMNAKKRSKTIMKIMMKRKEKVVVIMVMMFL
jgi:hypothetical protein